MSLLYRMGTGNGSGGDLKPYTVNFECANGYIGQTLTMTYQGTPHAGEVVDNVSGTVGSDRTLTLYPMHSGIWECSCYSSVTGKTMTKTIDLSYWGVQPTVTFEDIPNGATVTPTDDVQTWLHCANVWDKTDLTTIDGVIADTTTLNTLIANENANDYLVRSTTFATDICSNESAMTYIGLNDYCANKLLSDSTWLEAICNSTYFEKVLKALILPMTSNTGDDGSEAFASGSAGSGYEPYLAFTDGSSNWAISSSVSNVWLGYKFVNPVCINRFFIKNTTYANYKHPYTFKIQSSNDDFSTITYESEILTSKDTAPTAEAYYNIDCKDKCLSWRLYIIESKGGTWDTMGINRLQFYGREA